MPRNDSWHVDRMLSPPTTARQLSPNARYCCFLSHFKAESGSDARYLRDLLQRMFCTPVYLDSSELTDLRVLFTEGVQKSEVLVLLATRELLTRPWCLLELWEAVKKQIPIVIMAVRGKGWDIDEACALLQNIETELPARNPGALEELFRVIENTSLPEITKALQEVLRAAEVHAVAWTPHGTDNQVLASALDLADAMAACKGRDLTWTGRDAAPLRKSEVDEASLIPSKYAARFDAAIRAARLSPRRSLITQTVPTCRVAPPLAAPACSLLCPSPLRYYSSQRNVLVKIGTGLGGTFARRAKIEGSESLRAGARRRHCDAPALRLERRARGCTG